MMGGMKSWLKKDKDRGGQLLAKKIALSGTRPGVGVTHTAILLAEFLKERMGAKVAVLEMNRHGHMELIERELYGCLDTFFSFRGVDYYKEMGEEKLSHFSKSPYNYLILDFGTEKKKNEKAFKLCDEKVILGSLGLWEQQEYLMAVQHLKKNLKGLGIKCAVNFGNKKLIARTEKVLGQKIYFLGYQPFNEPVSEEMEYFFNILA